MLVSALSLSVTLLAYIFLHSELMNKTPGRVCTFKESQQQMIEFFRKFFADLHTLPDVAGRNLFCLASSLMVAYVALVAIRLGGGSHAWPKWACISAGIFNALPRQYKMPMTLLFLSVLFFFLQRYSCTFLSWQPLLGWLLIAGTFSFASGKSLSLFWMTLYRIFTRVPLLLLLKNMK